MNTKPTFMHSDIDEFCSFPGWPKSDECADCQKRTLWEETMTVRLRRAVHTDLVLDVWDNRRERWTLNAAPPEDVRHLVGAWLKEKF